MPTDQLANRPSSVQSNRNHAIDALRGYAIAAVILVHTGTHLPSLPVTVSGLCNWGQFGVQLFFIASAFTLAMSLDQRRNQERWPLCSFFLRRFFRIAPMFWLAIILYGVALVGLVPVAEENRGRPWSDLLWSASFMNGWTKTSLNSVVPGSWSIAAEWSFYLILPVIFPLLTTTRKAWWGCIAAMIFAVVAQAIAWGVIHYTDESAYALKPNPYSPFFRWWFPAQAVVFMLGIYLYRLSTEAAMPRRQQIISLASLATAIVVLMAIGHETVRMQHKAYLATLILAPAVYYLVTHPHSRLIATAIRHLGTVSFSAYLLHFLILDVAVRWTPVATWPWPLALPALFLGTVASTFALAWIAYRAIELPGIGLGKLLVRKLNS